MMQAPRKIFVTTDTHGELERLKAALALAGFDNDLDRLIHLGDCVDRGPDSAGVIEFLIGIRDLISLKGNHDDWLLSFIDYGAHPAHQYAVETFNSYDEFMKDKDMRMCVRSTIPASHHGFLRNQRLYYIDDQNRFFCHAGYDLQERIEEQDESVFYWDRDLIKKAKPFQPTERMNDVNGFKQIFVGHNVTLRWKKDGKQIDKPIYAAQLVNCDTGAVFGGKLSVIDITTDDHILYQV